MRKAVWIVLDSVGVGALPDAYLYGDEGTNTLGLFSCPPSNVDEFTIGVIFSIAGVFVNAREWRPVALPSDLRTVMTGERYLYSLFSRYFAAWGVHSTRAAMPSSLRISSFTHPAAGACVPLRV